MQRALTLAVAAVAASAATPASASLVYDNTIQLPSQGFGNAPRDLSIQGHNSTESGCVGVGAGGSITFGSCISNGQVHNSNGVANANGTADLVMPLADDQKYGIPTVGELGWASAADIGLLFNATEPGGNPITVNDITLKFYDAAGNFITAIDGGGDDFASTNPGNGVAGFTYVVDPLDYGYLAGTIFGRTDLSSIHIALESTLSGAAAGPETWTAVNLNRTPITRTPAVPEPGSWLLMLLGFGGMGVAMRRRGGSAGRLLRSA
jgi:hypothetical protein